jgi:hypothetical protein
MRYRNLDPQMFIIHRENLKNLMLPNSLAVANANDLLPANADGTLPLRPNSDLFYLTGIEQEETTLLLYREAHGENLREILFLRETNEHIATWEGHKFTKEEARGLSGIKRVEWLSECPPLFHRLMCKCGRVYLNSNDSHDANGERDLIPLSHGGSMGWTQSGIKTFNRYRRSLRVMVELPTRPRVVMNHTATAPLNRLACRRAPGASVEVLMDGRSSGEVNGGRSSEGEFPATEHCSLTPGFWLVCSEPE